MYSFGGIDINFHTLINLRISISINLPISVKAAIATEEAATASQKETAPNEKANRGSRLQPATGRKQGFREEPNWPRVDCRCGLREKWPKMECTGPHHSEAESFYSYTCWQCVQSYQQIFDSNRKRGDRTICLQGRDK